MSKPKRYPMHHGTFTLEYARIGGFCSFPDRLSPDEPEEFSVVIDEREKGKAKLIAIIHEFMHAEFPDMPEEVVDRASANIGSVMWGEGYRNREDIK